MLSKDKIIRWQQELEDFRSQHAADIDKLTLLEVSAQIRCIEYILNPRATMLNNMGETVLRYPDQVHL